MNHQCVFAHEEKSSVLWSEGRVKRKSLHQMKLAVWVCILPMLCMLEDRLQAAKERTQWRGGGRREWVHMQRERARVRNTPLSTHVLLQIREPGGGNEAGEAAMVQ